MRRAGPRRGKYVSRRREQGSRSCHGVLNGVPGWFAFKTMTDIIIIEILTLKNVSGVFEVVNNNERCHPTRPRVHADPNPHV